nr:hypothetical protein [Tanacetum cinerariifolium]
NTLGPTFSPGIVAGEGIPYEAFQRRFPGDKSPGKPIPSDMSPRKPPECRWGKPLML